MRGPKVPSFIDIKMITESQLAGIVAQHLEGTPLFPVEISIRSGNRIFVYIDGDQGVTIEDCKSLNRHIESMLDRETEDYDLTVSTAGADQPLKFPRQYPKHAGRQLEIEKTDGTSVTGKLVSADGDGIVIEPTAKSKKEPQPVPVPLSFPEIREARVKLSFK